MDNSRPMWVILADGENARFLLVGEDNVLRTEVAFSSASPRYSREIGTDKPGRDRGPAGRHAKTPQTDLLGLEKLRFVQFVAEQLCEASARGDFRRCVMAAPAPLLNELKRHLTPDCHTKLRGFVPKDLVRIPDNLLHRHFAEWVGPQRRESPGRFYS